MSYGQTLKLDPDGDIYLNDLKQFEMIEGIEKVKQDLKCILSTAKSDNIFDNSFGLDILAIKRSNGNKQVVEAEIRKALKQYQYLKSIDSIVVGSLDSNYNLPISINITTTDDETLLAGVVI